MGRTRRADGASASRPPPPPVQTGHVSSLPPVLTGHVSGAVRGGGGTCSSTDHSSLCFSPVASSLIRSSHTKLVSTGPIRSVSIPCQVRILFQKRDMHREFSLGGSESGQSSIPGACGRRDAGAP